MNITIEEEILKIFESEYDRYDHSTNIYSATKRVITLFSEFIKWKDKHVGTPNDMGNYLYWEDHFTLEELCNYWITYINEIKWI